MASNQNILFSPLVLQLFPLLLASAGRASATQFTIVNRCGYNIWPATLCTNGKGLIGAGGFDLPPSTSAILGVPDGWAGRIWARTSCNFNVGGGKCATGDCGSGIRCTHPGATPATIVEMTLDASGGKDCYNVRGDSGFNLKVSVTTKGICRHAGLLAELNRKCPKELQVRNGESGSLVGCMSASTPAAHNGASSTCVCLGLDYVITFCA